MLPLSCRQEPWVLQSASADQPHPPAGVTATAEANAAAALIQHDPDWPAALPAHPANLVLARAINQQAPQQLTQAVPRWLPRTGRKRLALLLPGELRSLERSRAWLAALRQHADLFICTTAAYAEAATSLRPTGLAVVDQHSDLLAAEGELPAGSMRQWHKLAVCLKLMRRQEARRGRLYRQVLKLRSDYFVLQPQTLLRELNALAHNPNAGLIGASDKVFAGSRDRMLLFEGFWQSLAGQFLDLEEKCWPINLTPILAGDDSAKWFGFGFPQRLVGQPTTVAELRRRLSIGGPELGQALADPWQPHAPLHTLCPHQPRFSSEVAFARFLNFNAIPMRESPGLRGFLYSDRS